MLPRRMPVMTPLLLQRTSSRAGGSLTMVISKSEAEATSPGDLASFAPAATSDSAREAVRFQTVSGKPALRRFRLMGEPMRPRPIKPTFGLEPALRFTKYLQKCEGAKSGPGTV